MIVYENGGSFGSLSSLFRVHGSAVYKVVLPSAVSTGILIGYEFISFHRGRNYENSGTTIVQDPFAIGAFIAFFRYERRSIIPVLS
jgi:hypothetical protein